MLVFRCFNVKTNGMESYLNSYQETDDYEKNAEIYRTLSEHLVDDVLNAGELMEDWFPQIKADVFISHSHADVKLAKSLKRWLKDELGLKAFIDSTVWGYSDDLLKKINEKYSKIEDGLYRYRNCNFAAQHVNLMLTSALQRMIDRTECIMFLNTENSVNQQCADLITKKLKMETYSPWIYTELLSTQFMRENQIERRGILSESNSINFSNQQSALKVSYGVEMELKNFKEITRTDFEVWKRVCSEKVKGVNALDLLYKMEGLVNG